MLQSEKLKAVNHYYENAYIGRRNLTAASGPETDPPSPKSFLFNSFCFKQVWTSYCDLLGFVDPEDWAATYRLFDHQSQILSLCSTISLLHSSQSPSH